MSRPYAPKLHDSLLEDVPHEVLRAYAYLCARIGMESGLLKEMPPYSSQATDALVCIDGRNGSVYEVGRPSDLTLADEETCLASLRSLILTALGH